MKRRDWKTKKLKKDSSGKFFIKRIRPLFLRELFLRKNSTFFKKNLVTLFYFYNFLDKSLNFKKTEMNKINYNDNFYYNFYYFFPNFFFKKKIFYTFNLFKDLLKNNDLDYMFIDKNSDYKNTLPSNNNIIVFNKQNKPINLKNLINEEDYNVITFKYDSKTFLIDHNINFFFNYNLFVINATEIYKIIIILYILKSK